MRGTSKDLLEDLVQSSLILVLERIATVESNPHLFALGILRHKIGDHLRTQSRRLEHTLSPTGSDDRERADGPSGLVLADPESETVEAQVERADAINAIRQAIKKLSPICQALFLGLLEGRTIGDVWELAAEMEPRLTRSTFDKRLFDCRKRLRVLIGSAI